MSGSSYLRLFLACVPQWWLLALVQEGGCSHVHLPLNAGFSFFGIPLVFLVYLFMCVATASGMDSFLYFSGSPFLLLPFWNPEIWLTSHHIALILASSLCVSMPFVAALQAIAKHPTTVVVLRISLVSVIVAVRIVHSAAFTSLSRL